MTYKEAMDRAKALQDRLFDSCNRDSKRPNNKAIILFKDEGWLNIVADALYSSAIPEEYSCTRSIKGCICNPREWGCEIPPVCPSFHPMSEEEPDICKYCEHEKGCHS